MSDFSSKFLCKVILLTVVASSCFAAQVVLTEAFKESKAPKEPVATVAQEVKVSSGRSGSAEGKDSNEANAIVLVDAGGNENVFSEDASFHVLFNAALDCGCCSIIVSGSIINNWLTFAKRFEQLRASGMSDAQRQLFEKAQTFMRKSGVIYNPFTADYSEMMDKKLQKLDQEAKALEWLSRSAYLTLRGDYLELEEERLKLSRLGVGGFDPALTSGCDCFLRQSKLSDYNVFRCKGTQEYLLIPKKFDQHRMAGRFAIQDKRVLEKIALDDGLAALKKQLNTWNPTLENVSYWRGGFLGPVVDFFRKTSWELWAQVAWDNLKKIFVPGSNGWIFYWGGHGQYTPLSGQQQGFRAEYLRDWNNLFDYAHIGGLSIPQHLDWLAFAGKTIKTRMVVEDTCFGGGFHARFTALQLRALAIEAKTSGQAFNPFTYIRFGLTNTSVSSGDVAHLVDYTIFFEKMREGTDASIAEGMTAVAIKYGVSGVLSTPMILKPGDKNFEPLDVYHVLHAIKTSKDAVCTINPAQTEGVLLYPDRGVGAVKISIQASDHSWVKPPLFITMSPVYRTTYFIDTVDLACGLDTFFTHSIFGFTEVAHRFFVIKNLHGLNYADSGLKLANDQKDIALEKVIIEKGYVIDTYGIFSDTIRVSGTVLCKIKGEDKYYKATITESFDEDSKDPVLSAFKPVKKEAIEKRAEIFALEL